MRRSLATGLLAVVLVMAGLTTTASAAPKLHTQEACSEFARAVALANYDLAGQNVSPTDLPTFTGLLRASNKVFKKVNDPALRKYTKHPADPAGWFAQSGWCLLHYPTDKQIVDIVTRAASGATTSGQQSTTTAATEPATTTPLPVFSQSGSGTATTATFTVDSSWDLAWSYDCSNFGGRGNFIVSINDASSGTSDFRNQGVNQLGPGGNGIEHYHSGGSKYLEVSSECRWAVIVTNA